MYIFNWFTSTLFVDLFCKQCTVPSRSSPR